MRWGIDVMQDLNALPLLRPGVQAHYEGSIDKRGGNADWDWWLYQDQRGEWVLFEACGPGCLYNMVQHRYLSSSDPLFRFYFDGESQPRFALHASEFGQKAPFVEPLAGHYIGPVDNGRGPIRVVRSFVPMPFAHSLKITSDVRLEGFDREKGEGGWGHVIWHSFAEDPGLRSFDGTENYSALTELYKCTGTDPKRRLPGQKHRLFDTTIPAGGRLTLTDVFGAGSVQAIRLKLRNFQPEQLSQLWVCAAWDGHEKLDVCSPAGAFFGNELGVHSARYLLLGMDTEGSMYSFFPMPFWIGARIVLENRGTDPLTLDCAEVEIAADNALRREDCGYFRTSEYYARRHTEGRDSMIARITGRGHVVGAVITAHGSRPGEVTCEGDVRVHIDGIRTPQIESDGSESYACYGWGFPTPPESNPFSGYDGQPDSPWSMVRTMPGDCYPFRSRVDFGIESGECNDQYLEHSGIVFYYGREEAAMAETDSIDFSDEACCEAHAVSDRRTRCEMLTAFFEGDDDDVAVRGCAAAYEGSLTFECRIDENNRGIRLRRQSDQRTGRQAARVYVDGECVQERVWCAPDRNEYKRWLEDEFEIAARYTRGKSHVCIRIEPLAQDGQIAWNQAAYRVFSLR